jgi:cytidylate kinase
MIIAIDGPTASGKSTLARRLAEKLNVYYVSTGLLYRALAYILTHHFKYPEQDLAHPHLNDVKSCLDKNSFLYDYKGSDGAAIFFKGEDITPFLKTKDIDTAASLVAANKAVREELLNFQRAFAKNNSVVMEGRDIGSIIFPNADYKFFVTALPQVRAERWREYQSHKGNQYSLEESLKAITERDTRDKERPISPLVVAKGAIEIDTTNLTKEEALQKVLSYIDRS